MFPALPMLSANWGNAKSADMAVDPGEHVVVDLLLAGLVQDLVAHALVELHLDVFDPRLLEQGGRAFHAAPLVPYRVERAGDEQDRQLGGNLERRIERRDLSSKARERRVGASRERLAAQVVGDVGIDDGGVSGEPIERRARIFDGL